RRFAHFARFSSERDVHPELGVAIGAAILGRNLARGASGLADVVPTAIGIMSPGAGSVEIIPANTPVPCTRRVVLENLPPGNAPVPVAIFEALDRTAVDRELLGTLQVGSEWRISSSAPPTLELQIGQDFVISANLVSALAKKPVSIVDARPQSRR
ncbi:MAG: Hsp70 family protein, partial [Myxococcales bacterium]